MLSVLLRTRLSWSLAAACCLPLAAPAIGEVDSGAHPDFSGSWELNLERSDDARELIAAAMRSRVEQPSRGGFGVRPGSGSDDARSELRERIETLVVGPRVVTIAHADPELTIESALPDRPFELTIYTDGREFPLPGPGDGELRATAEWRGGGRLVMEYEISAGRPVRETWELVADGARVLVATEIKGRGSMSDLRIQRVYDRVEIVPWDVPD